MADEQEQQQNQEPAKPVYKVSSGIPTPEEYEAQAQPQNVEDSQESTANLDQDQNQDQGQEQNTESQNEQLEGNEASFQMPSFDGEGEQEEQGEAQAQSQQVVDWKSELKKADPKEILKELGYDEFLAEFAEFRKNGGDAYKYLEAKAFDWETVSHQDLILDELRLQYPHLTDEKVEKLYQAKYKQSEYASEEDKEIGAIQLEADAELVRQKRIAEQKSFQIPDVMNSQEANEMQERYAEQQKIEAERVQQALQFFKEHEATRNLMESKRVAIDLGDNGKFNFTVDKPETLMSIALDSEKWQRAIAVNPQEADPSKLIPDVAKLQKIALVALNPNYEKDLVNYGKSLGLKSIVEEGQNARRPVGSVPAQPNESFAEAIKNRAKVGVLGR
jgi:hypothetical protein